MVQPIPLQHHATDLGVADGPGCGAGRGHHLERGQVHRHRGELDVHPGLGGGIGEEDPQLERSVAGERKSELVDASGQSGDEIAAQGIRRGGPRAALRYLDAWKCPPRSIVTDGAGDRSGGDRGLQQREDGGKKH